MTLKEQFETEVKEIPGSWSRKYDLDLNGIDKYLFLDIRGDIKAWYIKFLFGKELIGYESEHINDGTIRKDTLGGLDSIQFIINNGEFYEEVKPFMIIEDKMWDIDI